MRKEVREVVVEMKKKLVEGIRSYFNRTEARCAVPFQLELRALRQANVHVEEEEAMLALGRPIETCV